MDNVAGIKRQPPRNSIIPEKLGDRLETKLDGIIVDQDISAAEQTAMRASISSSNTLTLVFGVVITLVLLLIVGLIVWRGLAVEEHLKQCEAVGALSVPIQG